MWLDEHKIAEEILRQPGSTDATLAAPRSTVVMMAFDRTPSSPNLEPSTVEALRRTFGEAVAQGNHVTELRAVLCAAAAEAHEKDIQAEQLLVILKDIWYSLPAVKVATSSEREVALLRELITLCIKEYYAG
jgi:hypothetical protein